MASQMRLAVQVRMRNDRAEVRFRGPIWPEAFGGLLEPTVAMDAFGLDRRGPIGGGGSADDFSRVRYIWCDPVRTEAMNSALG